MERLEVEEALDKISVIKPILETEDIDIVDALGRVLAEDILSPIDLPPFNRSPLDGFAFIGRESEKGKELKIIEEITAGHVAKRDIREGECIRIMTGAPIPKGATSVARLESVEEKDGYIILDKTYEDYENFVYKGEELKKSSHVFGKGKELNAIDLGTLANLGIAKIRVYRLPKIAVISTGSELVDYKEELVEGKIFNSNNITLSQRLRELGLEASFVGRAEDDLDLLISVFSDLSKEMDLIISTGGVSVGDADYMDQVLDALGCQDIFSKIKMKPGGHILARQNESSVFLALSGNPFAALTTFEIFGRQILERLTGKDLTIKKRKGTLKSSFPKASRGRRYIRAYYEDRKVYLPDEHESSKIYSASSCNALIDIKAGTGPLEKGDEVSLWLL